MSVSISKPPSPEIIYPDSDGEPMAENTLQFQWIVTIKEGLDWVFRDRPDVFVAGDLLWYPVEGEPEDPQAPDAMVVFGRPKGYRGSYKQWEEGGIAPQVVFEVLSPGNRPRQMIEKFEFYERVRGRGVLPLRPRHLRARRVEAGREQARRDRRDERMGQPAAPGSDSTPRRANSASSDPTDDAS